ncbi:DUF6308 family protein [Glutamicibacter bergerei]|uniref:DUF6308 family protein n=1 Tax=Glutamicibacter bergerei TaxID=256702 RepID=A0ABV9MIE2_9MICC|nr:hypothetical protein [Micrococcaceae bacterium]
MHTAQSLGHDVWGYIRGQLSNAQADGSVTPSERANGYLRTYLTGSNPVVSGQWPAIGRRFEHLGTPDDSPNVITATDLVAVSFLSVNVPPRPAWTILTKRASALTEVLGRIPSQLAIEDLGCTAEMYQSESALQELWNLLRRDEEGNLWKMGATTVSKLMARKRPALVPIQDSVVMRELDSADSTYWVQWWQAMHLQIEGHAVVTEFARQLRSSVPEARHLSLLRTLDIAIWMHGKKRIDST